ncbi:hypothetical protein [Taibaiella chishuiensis]|uniref:Uncharacterized protein n=1 Tax=Taibaiella chishuiensis TaxID=1434707 RepID=A0A2P8D7E7_9BACT|nr:hypothetical protein [Taibaiella chishuiensis]PSK93156.1 hypothetical protein B0I18_102126 [Taibaiella chishuiensis]
MNDYPAFLNRCHLVADLLWTIGVAAAATLLAVLWVRVLLVQLSAPIDRIRAYWEKLAAKTTGYLLMPVSCLLGLYITWRISVLPPEAARILQTICLTALAYRVLRAFSSRFRQWVRSLILWFRSHRSKVRFYGDKAYALMTTARPALL